MSTALAIYSDLQYRTSLWPLRAAELLVQDQQSLDQAAGLLHDIKALREEIARYCDPVIEAAHKTHKAAVAQKRELESELVEADGEIRRKVAEYTAEQQRIAREEAARALAAQRALMQQAEHDAQKLRAAGDHELAEQVVLHAELASAPPAAVTVPRAQGVSSRETWTAEVEDLAALVRAITEGKAPLAAVQPDMKVLHGLARSLKDQFGLPGVVARRKVGVSVR